MDDLELEPVRVVEEHRVVPRGVGVFLRLALDLGPDSAQPFGSFLDEPIATGLPARSFAATVALPVTLTSIPVGGAGGSW